MLASSDMGINTKTVALDYRHTTLMQPVNGLKYTDHKVSPTAPIVQRPVVQLLYITERASRHRLYFADREA